MFEVMRRRRVGQWLVTFATGRGFVHLSHLVHRAQAARQLDTEGVAWERAVISPPSVHFQIRKSLEFHSPASGL